MSTESKVDEAAQLAERMLQVLQAQRSFGGDAYPPTLRHLGELCDGTPSHELITQAATRKPFTDAAIVTEKANKKPALDSPVYFKDDVPGKEELLAKRMLATLESQRRQGGDAYPPTLRRLAELCEATGTEGRIAKAASHAIMADRTMVIARKGKAPSLDAPVVLKEDLAGDVSAFVPPMLRFALSTVTATTKGKTIEIAAFSPKDLAKRLIPELQSRFEDAVAQAIATRNVPPEVAWVVVKGVPLLFLVRNLQRGSSPRATIEGAPTTAPSPVRGEMAATAANAAAARSPHNNQE
jgi:hypothetical protein